MKQGLSYCNRCGLALNAKDDKLTGASLESIIWAIVAVSVGGLVMLIGLMSVMKEVLKLGTGLILLFTALSFLIIAGAESVFIWVLFSSRRRAKEKEEKPQLKKLDTSEIILDQPRAFPEPVPSVIERTTRNMEPVKNDRETE